MDLRELLSAFREGTVSAPGGRILVTRVRADGGQKVASGAFAKTAGLLPGARLGAA